jgi:transposase
LSAAGAGVDTHRDTLAAAAADPVGGVLGQTAVSADAAGYQRLLAFAQVWVPGRRCWAVEGAGSYGAGLATFLQAHGERVVEIARPKRPARRIQCWLPGPLSCDRRSSEGKSIRDIRRCLKRAVARQLFKLLERCDCGQVDILSAA